MKKLFNNLYEEQTGHAAAYFSSVTLSHQLAGYFYDRANDGPEVDIIQSICTTHDEMDLAFELFTTGVRCRQARCSHLLETHEFADHTTRRFCLKCGLLVNPPEVKR